MTAGPTALAVRPARDTDDLARLWPDTAGRRMNRDQVLVVPDEGSGTLLGGAILHWGGHDRAIVAAVSVAATPWARGVFRAVLTGVQAWCAERGVRRVMHLAGTPECEAILQRLGGQPRGRVRMVTLDDEDLRRAHAEPDPSTVRLRFVSPFEASDQAALRGLILSTHARHPDRPPLWNVMVTTLGAWQGDRLVGYVQFSVAPRATYLYGIRVDPELRGQHLGRRLFAGWLQAVQTCHGEIAYGCATPDNTAMRGLFERAGFEADGMISASPEPEVFYVGDARAFAWAGGEPKESLTERGDTPWA